MLLLLLLLFMLLLIPHIYLQSLVKVGSGTAEILMTFEFLWWSKVIFVSNPTVELRLGWGCDNENDLRPEVTSLLW